MKALFVAGTDTGVGKTVVTGCLANYAKEKGLRVATQKWIQTGAFKNSSADIRFHLKFMGRKENDIKGHLDDMMPYTFKTACSPHLASQIEKRRIHSNRIIKSFRFLSSRFDFVIVEGTGGVLVPFNQKKLIVDIVRDLGIPVLLVAKNRLGAIHQTLSALEALKARKIKILGIIFNNFQGEDKRILEDNPRIIQKLTKETALGILPWSTSLEHLYKNFVPVAGKIWRQLLH